MQNLKDKRIIFAGTPDFAAVHLQALIDNGIKPVAVYTQPDRPAGRGNKLKPSEVKVLALENGIEVRTPENFKDEADVDAFKELKADICIVVAYGVILPESIINACPFGCINVHGSILPMYRGAAPIQRALLDGQKKTGVSIMKVAKKLDAGDVYTIATLDINDTDTSGTLFDRLASLGAKTLLEALDGIFAGTLKATAQDESLATYAKKLTKEEALIDFTKTACEVELKVRGLSPWPVAITTRDDVKYKVFHVQAVNEDSTAEPGCITKIDKEGILVACSKGQVRLVTIQAP
ncbi:methionyl-tRNA formyltransferase, partial [Succinivibrio sp.]|uniref:methionyl-tRNA formyltransferase n=1 Tax=Succinivibrio sp. TaxID=2053619 RepID=UPI00386BF719